MKPSSRAAASSVDSSPLERRLSKRRHTIALKQESQYHCHG
jgi:hypothetical protein